MEEKMRKNKLREILKNNGPSVGTRVESAWPLMTELVGAMGHFDYIEYVAEYSP